MAKRLNLLYKILEHSGLAGKLNSDDNAKLQKAIKNLDHALKIKDIKSVTKAIDSISRLIVENR